MRVRINSPYDRQWNTVTGMVTAVKDCATDNGQARLMVAYIKPDAIAGIIVRFPVSEITEIE